MIQSLQIALTAWRKRRLHDASRTPGLGEFRQKRMARAGDRWTDDRGVVHILSVKADDGGITLSDVNL